MKLRSINPYSGKITGEFDAMSFADCRLSVSRARETFAQWRKLPLSERLKPVAKLASLFRDRKRNYAEIATTEMGKPIRQAIAEIEKCVVACDYYCQNSEEFLRDEIIETQFAKSYVTFEPLGVILGIMPWNFPFWQAVRWAVPALAAGNVCLLKHAPNVPMTALELEKVFREAGFPEYAFQTLLIDVKTAEGLIEGDLVDGVSLTGSLRAGSKVASLAGKQIRKVILELGGSDPLMVLEDADLDKAAEVAVNSRTVNAGQSCISAKRMIVMESVAEDFVRKFLKILNGLKIGDPMDEATNIGPIAREEILQGLLEQLRDAERKGAVVHRGPKPPHTGFFFQPVLLTNVNSEMRVLNEEVFGPMAPVISVSSEEEMIRIANGTEFGLGASIWSKNTAHAERLAREIVAGFVAVNGRVRSDPRLPFGGVKKSGIGRELSHYGIKQFVNAKTVIIA
jgi:succinate-semialdehyde dehydrogenase / glutarate-semialdehyde dehydrogenase